MKNSKVAEFTAIGNKIYPPLAAIKHVGEKTVSRLNVEYEHPFGILEELNKSQLKEVVKVCPEVSAILWWGGHLAGEPAKRDVSKVTPMLSEYLNDPEAQRICKKIYKKYMA